MQYHTLSYKYEAFSEVRQLLLIKKNTGNEKQNVISMLVARIWNKQEKLD